MKLGEFQKQIDELVKDVSILDIHVSLDFQCDQTGGFPTTLCALWSKAKAWLEPNHSLVEDCSSKEIDRFMRQCADFGIRDCRGENDFNELLKELGDDAVQSATIYDEDIEQDENAGITMK